MPKRNQVFYIGTNSSRVLTTMRRDILSQFKHLPTSGEYLHRDCYDAAKKYSKDTFIVIDKLGADYIPKLFEFKRIVDLIANKIKVLPDQFSDRLMQFLSKITFNHLPHRMENYRDKYEHHWLIETYDEVIEDKGVKVFIDSAAVMYLFGTEMDYKQEEFSSQFVFNNPNETERCGCGESFKI